MESRLCASRGHCTAFGLIKTSQSSATMEGATISVNEVRDIYDKAYANPGLMGTHLDAEYSRVTKTTLLDMCLTGHPHWLLDVGTGDGDLWQFAPEQWQWVAIDISQIGVRRTVDRFHKVLGAAGLAEGLPYPDDHFGAVVAADTIEHVFNIEASLAEIRRVLVTGGSFALSVPTPNSLPKWAYNRFVRQRPSPKLLVKLIYTIVWRTLLFGNPTFQPIDRDLSLAEWEQLLRNSGFIVERTVAWPEPPLKPIVYLIGTKSGSIPCSERPVT